MKLEEVSFRWHNWSVHGAEKQIDEMLNLIKMNLPISWRNIKDNELNPLGSLVRQNSTWFVFESREILGGVTPSIERFVPTMLRGGRVLFRSPPNLRAIDSMPALWEAVMRLLEDCIVPAAAKVGLKLGIPRRTEIFLAELPSHVRERLEAFATQEWKDLPLDLNGLEVWRDFVVAAFRYKVVIAGDLFAEWLTEQGWRDEVAKQLAALFAEQCSLLSRYTEEVLAV